MWTSVIGVVATAGALWGPDELRDVAAALVAVTAALTLVHATVRPRLLRWANPTRPFPIPEETRHLLQAGGVTAIGISEGTVSDGGEESDDLRLRTGSLVMLAPSLAGTDARRLAALALAAPHADRGTVAPAVLSVAVAVLAAQRELWPAVVVAAIVLAGSALTGIRHTRRSSVDEAALEQVGSDASAFVFLVQGLTLAARRAREEPAEAAELWRTWVGGARDAAAETDDLRPSDVDAEVARLPDVGR